MENPEIHCTSLQFIDLSFSTGFSDEVISKTLQTNKLTSATLRHMNSLKNPIIKSETLKKLRFDRCKKLENPIIECPELEELDLSFTKLNDNVIQSIVQGCNSLRTLYLRGCRELVSPVIELPNLQILLLDYCSKLSHPTISCSSLEKLDMSFTKVRDEVLEDILSASPLLKQIRASKCEAIVQPKIYSES